MNTKAAALLTVLLVFALILSGCAEPEQPEQPEQPEPTSPTTSTPTTQPEPAPQDSGPSFPLLGGGTITVEPSTGNTVNGIVTVTLENAPAGTGIVMFMVVTSDNDEGGPVGMDMDGSDGWSFILDTTDYENGVYTVGAVSGDADSIGDDSEPLGAASKQIIIDN